MLFPQERARLSSIGREGNARFCRILLPCLKQLQTQQTRCRARKSPDLLEKIRIPIPCLRHDECPQAACRDGHSRSGSWADHDNAFHSAAEELVSTGDEAIAVCFVRAFKVLEAIGCRTTEYDIEPQNRI